MIKQLKEKMENNSFYTHDIGADARNIDVKYPNSSSELIYNLQYLIDNGMIGGGGGGSAGTWTDIFPSD